MTVFIIWLLALVVIVANGWNTALWIFFIGSAFLVILAVSGNQKPAQNKGQNTTRIDHPHYIDLDDHQCPKCGARFRENVMACPKCGARFTGTKEDDEEFIEEMELWDDD